jgi:2,3-bisphosphoglycerate-dependent phosphoglycerate mutase
VLPYYEAAIAPQLAKGETVIVAAIGNSLRALVKHLSKISDEDILNLKSPPVSPSSMNSTTI